MTAQQLQHMRDARPAIADRVDIKNVHVDMNAPAAGRAEQYLRQIKNPYAFRCGDVAVNVLFSPTGKSLKEAVISWLTVQKNIV